ncbi:hypothetical protein [Microbacterium sp. XT11]|uniref:hypothetical protein n=1 Tax=Microbacterium sp. XT11 TaxID=367477 RepID=UPI0008319A79|nr:hypothetical protein [Microbacterium sp. XT11]
MSASKSLGPVHLYPERPKVFRKGDNVAHADNPDRWGRVSDVVPHRVGEPERYAVAWEDGGASVHFRAELLSRFTTTTPKPRERRNRKARA